MEPYEDVYKRQEQLYEGTSGADGELKLVLRADGGVIVLGDLIG